MGISRETLSNDKSVAALKLLLETIGDRYDATPDEIFSLISDHKEDSVPLSVFSNRDLGVLETIVKYLKENKGKRYSEIASLLSRDQRTIWATYSKASAKSKNKLWVKPSPISIPLSVFASRDRSPLGSLVNYLRKQHKLSYKEIADALFKDYQTIYTTHRREGR
jgi:hypothetical protein